MGARIRTATEADAFAIQAIYAPFCTSSPVSFELQPPSESEIAGRIRTTLVEYPWLVWEQEGRVAGYAYASRHRVRAAYRWSVDVSVYVGADEHRKGGGCALYGALLKTLTLQGFYRAFAGITLPNAASVGLHQAFGFRQIGVYHRVGYKLGVWHDVSWWELPLREAAEVPAEPRPFSVVRGSAEIMAALEGEHAGDS